MLPDLLAAAGNGRGGHHARDRHHGHDGRELDAPLLHADLRRTGAVRCTRPAPRWFRNSAISSRHLLGPLELRGVAGVLDDRRAPVRRHRGDPLRGRRVALVAGAGDREQRQLERAQLVPDRLEHALARGAQQQRERARVLATAAPAAAPRRAGRTGPRTAAGAPRARRCPRSASPPSTRRAARPPRRGRCEAARSSMPAVAPTVTTAGEATRVTRSAARRPAARRASSRRARTRLGRRSDLGQAALERVLAVVEERARIAFRQELRDRPPGVATLHEARDEEHHRSRMIPINRTYAPLQAFVDELYRCGMRHAVTCSGLAQRPARAHARGPGGRRGGVGDRRALRRLRRARDGEGERPAGGRHLHLGHRRGQPPPRRRRGPRGARAADRAHRRPAARAARGGRRASRSTRSSSTGAPPSGSSRWAPTSPAARPPSTTARSPAAPTGPPPAAARGRCTSTSRCASRSRPSREELDPADWEGRPDGRPWTELREHASAPHADDVHELAARIAAEPRGLIVCGPVSEDVAEAAARLAAEAGWPLLAEPTSGVRCGDHDRSHVVAHYDVLLRVERFADAHAPGLVLRVGDMPTSKPLRAGCRGGVTDRARPARRLARADAAGGAAAPRGRRAHAGRPGGRDRDADRRARSGLARVAGATPTPRSRRRSPPRPTTSSRRCWPALEPELPDGAIVWVSSSMPIRDVEACFPQSPKRLRFLANRGANGIDGVVSSAAGRRARHRRARPGS